MVYGDIANPTTRTTSETLLPVVNQAMILANKYDVCVANPPYMGSKYQTPLVKRYLKDNFKGYEKDLFSAFIIRNLQLTRKHGELGFMTPFVWMFISSYEKLRFKLINDEVISSLVQLEYSGFEGATVPICTFTITKGYISNYKGSYIRLSDFKGSVNQGPRTLEAIQNHSCGWFFEAKPDDFKKIPSTPIAYWISEQQLKLFSTLPKIKEIADVAEGSTTGDVNRFLKMWHEIDFSTIGFNHPNSNSAKYSEAKWFPYNKGGEYRKWYGNNDYVVNWQNDGESLKSYPGSFIRGEKHYFKRGITWSKVSSGDLSFRAFENGYLFDTGGLCLFTDNRDYMIALLNSNASTEIMKILAPTLNFTVGTVSSIPYLKGVPNVESIAKKLVMLSKNDWDSKESSWDFSHSNLIANKESTLKLTVQMEQQCSVSTVQEVISLENELNDKLSNAYGVPFVETKVKNISLHCNIYKTEQDIQIGIFQSKLISELLSYFIGCIQGRYSLDREGLVYAHSANQGFKELVAEGAYKTFPADDDGIVPLASEDWLFEDDATSRFREFVQTVWGEEHLQENLDFVAESLCLDAIKPKKNESTMDTIRRYFSMQFYKDHLKTYKKRPIYWLFSSGKEKAFECLVYLHRYNESTLARMRTEYVTPLMGKMESQYAVLSESRANATSAEQRRIDKELKSIEKKRSELRAFDEELKHLAEMKIAIDLDDGVKVNYGKFGNLLANVKAIHGKEPKKLS